MYVKVLAREAVPQERPLVAAPAPTLELGQHAAVPGVRSALGDHVDDAAGGAAELGGVARRLDLHFLEEVRSQWHRAGALLRARRVDPVDDEAVLGARRAVNRDAAGLRLVRRASGLSHDVGEIPTARQQLDFFTRDVGRGRRAGEIDADGGGGNLNRLRDAGHRQRELDARRRADRQVDRALPGGEPAQARVDLVDARRQPREAELALLVRYRVDDPRRAGGLDGHAGKHCATGVVDDPDDRTGRFLGSRRSCQHEQADEHCQSTLPHLEHPPEDHMRGERHVLLDLSQCRGLPLAVMNRSWSGTNSPDTGTCIEVAGFIPLRQRGKCPDLAKLARIGFW